MHLYTKKSNADRGALRLAARTGDLYKVEAASDGRFFVAIVEKPAPTPVAQKAAAQEAARAAVKRVSQKTAAQEAASRGELPTAPDFTAATHKPYRAKLAKLVALAEASDADGLAAIAINPSSTSPKALIRYRDLAIAAIRARAA